jgi:serine/threonine protein kinase
MVTDSALDLLDRMLKWNPKDRISAAEALSHSFFTEEPLPCDLIELTYQMPFAFGTDVAQEAAQEVDSEIASTALANGGVKSPNGARQSLLKHSASEEAE